MVKPPFFPRSTQARIAEERTTIDWILRALSKMTHALGKIKVFPDPVFSRKAKAGHVL
jgi:hypothetical protein